MTAQRAFRMEAADPRPMTRPELEAAAARHGVTVGPSMTDRAVHEAIASKLLPGAFSFAAPRGPAYAQTAGERALAQANTAAAAADATAAAARPAAPAGTDADPLPAVNGTGAPHQDAAPPPGGIVSAEDARDAMIRRSGR